MKRTALIWVRWLAVFGITTAVVGQFSSFPELRIAHGVLVYLLLIVGASREGGRGLATAMVALSYLAVDYYFVPPRHAIGMPIALDLIILVGFVITAAVIAQLVIRLRTTATVATDRAAEIERLGVERLQLERQVSRAEVLQEAERLKDALLASLSHDLRSPLMAMTLLADPDSGMSSSDALPRIREQAKRLEAFLSTIGRVTMSGDVGGRLHLESHGVAELVRAAVAASFASLAERPVVTHASDSGAALVVRCDFTLSLQIIGNLLQNAARYSPPYSPIDIHSALDAGRVRITVSDRGPGILSADVEQIFRPMWRGVDAAERTPGTGMGLAIARTFARAQGGDVAYRPRVGGGSHFDALLPIAADALHPAA